MSQRFGGATAGYSKRDKFFSGQLPQLSRFILSGLLHVNVVQEIKHRQSTDTNKEGGVEKLEELVPVLSNPSYTTLSLPTCPAEYYLASVHCGHCLRHFC